MVALPVLTENALDLVDKVPINCCAVSDVNIDPVRPGVLRMSCRSCALSVEVKVKETPLRKKNILKRRETILRDMVQALENLIERWNYLVITGEQM